MADIQVNIGAKDSTGSGVNSAKGNLKSIGTTWIDVAKGMLAFDVFKNLARSAFNFVKSCIDAFAKQEMAIKKLSIAMKNNGSYTKEALQDQIDFAAALQRTTAFAHEDISQVQALLSTFGIAGNTLKKTTAATLDLSTALGVDLESAAKLLGKAYMGNTSALSRYGIIVNESIPKSERFAAVMGQLRDRFGGSASADLETYAGKLEKLKNLWGEILETLGKKFTDILGPAAQKITEAMEKPLAARFAWLEKIPYFKKQLQEYNETQKNGLEIETRAGEQAEKNAKIEAKRREAAEKAAEEARKDEGKAAAAKKKGRIAEQEQEKETAEDLKDTIIKTAEEGGAGALNSFITGKLKEIQATSAAEVAKLIMMAPATMGASLAGIPQVLAELAAATAALSSIKMAEGGIVTRPTLATVGEAGPEAVIPLKKSGGIMGSTTININSNFAPTSRDAARIAKVLDRALVRRQRKGLTVSI